MAKHRTHSIEFKRQVAQEFLAGETLHGLAKRHDVCRNLIRVWVQKYEAGDFDEDAAAADLLQQYEAQIAALERLVGKAGAGTGVSKGGSEKRTATEKCDYVRHCRPHGLGIAEQCRLMGISRSTYYEPPNAAPDDTAIVEAIAAICDEFEFYGWRRVRAETWIFLLTGFAGVGLFSLGAELQIAQSGSISEGYGPTYLGTESD
jgi:hypothetical protein